MNDFKQYLPTYENQFFKWGDAFDCTSYAFLNYNELKQRRQIENKTMSIDALKFLSDNGYFDDEGKVNYSDQFTAIMSDNTKIGNTHENVLASALRDGLIPDKMFQDNPQTWDEYYDRAKITPAMKALGQEWLKHFTITNVNKFAKLEVSDDILWATIPVCPGYNSGQIIQACALPQSHSVVINVGTAYHEMLDSYPPNYKKLASNYPIFAKWTFNIFEEFIINNNLMKIIGDKRDNKQYILGKDNYKRWIYSVPLLNDLDAAGAVDKTQVEWLDNTDKWPTVETWALIK